MKKLFVLAFVLFGISQAVIKPVDKGASSVGKIQLDPSNAYALIDVPKGRGIVGTVTIDNGAPRWCDTVSYSTDTFQEVCILGKRESFSQTTNIKVFKNGQLYDSGTISY